MPQGPATRRFTIGASCCSEQFLFTVMSCDAIKNGHSSNVALRRRSLRHIVNQPFYVNPVCTHNMQIKSPYCLRILCVHTLAIIALGHMHAHIHTHTHAIYAWYSWPLPYSCKQCCMPVYAGQLERSVVFVCGECVGMWEVRGRNKAQSPTSDDSSQSLLPANWHCTYVRTL